MTKVEHFTKLEDAITASDSGWSPSVIHSLAWDAAIEAERQALTEIFGVLREILIEIKTGVGESQFARERAEEALALLDRGAK